MVFSAFIFVCLFLPLVLMVNRFLPIAFSNVFLLIVSILFYYFGEQLFTIILLASIVWNYLFGILYLKFTSSKWNVKYLLWIFIGGHLGLLIYYKYFAFFIKSFGLESFVSSNYYDSIILPIGISFFTFQGISYVIDVYRGTEIAEKNPIKLGLFVTYFPQLIAGPIIKYNEIAADISERSITTEKLVLGSQKFVRGLTKKVVFADNFSLVADAVFNMDYSSLPTPIAWIGLIFYSLQIYFDFSGYSDMAIGMGQMMGFNIPENFNFPYIAKSVQDFWRRWHISLSTWFRNYLYIPLGGNRLGAGRTYVNLIIVFFITGLWHGASYNFIIWGMIHGFFIITERIFKGLFDKIPSILKRCYLLFVVTIAWVFFRTPNFTHARHFLSKLFKFNLNGDYSSMLYFSNYMIALAVLGILISLGFRQKIRNFFNWKNPLNSIALVIYLGLLFYCLSEMAVSTSSPFIYFKF